MNRLWLICALAALCAGCVARKEPANNAPPANRQAAITRAPLPLFHPEYKAGQPHHEYSESTESNLRQFALLVQQTVSIKAARRDGVSAEERVWVTSTDPELIANVRWAFSGNLMETRSPGLSLVPLEFVFVCADGAEIRLDYVGHYYSAEFPGATWSMILATPEMRATLEPLADEVFERFQGYDLPRSTK